MTHQNYSAADMVIDTLKHHGIDYVFGIPGAKIDFLFNALKDDGPELIVTRHEQNAAMIAQGIGRLTGKPGVALVTSGPGVSNLTTGLLTATSEGDPVLAIGGQVKRNDLLRLTHQSVDNASLLRSSTKFSAEVQDPESLSEVMTNAIREATSGKNGASFISIPQDVISAPVQTEAITVPQKPKLGVPAEEDIKNIVEDLKSAQSPVLLVGMRSSSEAETHAIRQLVEKSKLPVVETFQGAGVISRELESHFFGRIGLFRNQVGDELLRKSDLVITIGYDPIEYEASNWNKELETEIINIDEVPAEITNHMQPKAELIGNISETIQLISEHINHPILDEEKLQKLDSPRDNVSEATGIKATHVEGVLHPIEIIDAMQKTISDDSTVTVDVGSHYIWMARKFRSYKPRHLLFSNGMQTLGVALPWAIAAALVRPHERVISVAGDGGFLFSGQELETAVRKNLNITQLIWNDGRYNMVEFQEEMKYQRSAGVEFGEVDFVKYAESFGAKGVRVTTPAELEQAIKESYTTEGPVLIDIPVNYADNIKLSTNVLPDALN